MEKARPQSGLALVRRQIHNEHLKQHQAVNLPNQSDPLIGYFDIGLPSANQQADIRFFGNSGLELLLVEQGCIEHLMFASGAVPVTRLWFRLQLPQVHLAVAGELFDQLSVIGHQRAGGGIEFHHRQPIQCCASFPESKSRSKSEPFHSAGPQAKRGE